MAMILPFLIFYQKFKIVWFYFVRVYNICWGLNHQLKLLAELVPWHGIRSQRDKRSQVRISTTPHLKWNTQRLCASTLLAQWALVWEGVLEYITYLGILTISLSFWLTSLVFVSCRTHVYPHFIILPKKGWTKIIPSTVIPRKSKRAYLS